MASAVTLDLSLDTLSLAQQTEQQSHHNPNQPLYSPLNDSRGEFRLLEIISWSKVVGPCIECNLVTCSLGDALPYTALSYVWGDPEDTETIQINHRRIEVTKNLAEALLQIRGDGYVQMIWVDAVCINQQDQEEKGRQVHKMAQIYQPASYVIGWLGAEDQWSKHGMYCLSRVAHIAQALDVWRPGEPRPGIIHMPVEERKAFAHTLLQRLAETGICGVVGYILLLMQRSYWKRLWIIQELALARFAVLCCGPDHISWDRIGAALGIIDWLSIFLYCEGVISMEPGSPLWKLFYPLQPSVPRLPAVLWLSTNYKYHAEAGIPILRLAKVIAGVALVNTTLPHDRIYGLLGLLKDNDRNSVVIDYAISYTTLFSGITLHIMRGEGPRFLVHCRLANHNSSCNTLPSWAFDWTAHDPETDDILDRTSAGATRHEPSQQPYHVRIVRQDWLVVSGCVLDRITDARSWSGKPYDLCEVISRIEHSVLNNDSSKQSLDGTGIRRSAIRAILLEVPGIGDSLLSVIENMILEGSDDMSNLGSSSSIDQGLLSPELPLWASGPRTLFTTANGYIGTGPMLTQNDDVICALPECWCPLLLRPILRGEVLHSYKLLGPIWVDRLIDLDDDGNYGMEAFWKIERHVEDIMLS